MQNTSERIGLVMKLFGFVLLLAVIAVLGTPGKDKKDKALEEETHNVARSAEEICPILIGDKVPDLTLRTVDGKLFNLNKALRNKPTVLIFYRGGWCPYCSKHLGQLQEIETDIIKSGFQIIAISPDKPEKLNESIGRIQLSSATSNYLIRLFS